MIRVLFFANLRDYAGVDSIEHASFADDEAINLAKKYGIKSIPAVLVFRDGEVAQNTFGSKPYETYSNILETQLRL